MRSEEGDGKEMETRSRRKEREEKSKTEAKDDGTQGHERRIKRLTKGKFDWREGKKLDVLFSGKTL